MTSNAGLEGHAALRVPPVVNTRSKQSLREFAHSLPDSYRERFAPAQMAVHAHVATTRGVSSARVASFPWHDPSLTALVVVADDRPGLLAMISAAFVEEGLDIESAEAFTRKRDDGRFEAVDLFWVRRLSGGGAVTDKEIGELSVILNELLAGLRTPVPARDSSPAPGFVSETTVRFIEGDDRALNVLEVETDDRSGLLLALSRALFEMRVQITASQVRTTGKRVFDRFVLLELDGSPIEASRRLEIQVGVLTAIEPVSQAPQARTARA